MGYLPGWPPDKRIQFFADHNKVPAEETDTPIRLLVANPGSGGVSWSAVFDELNQGIPTSIDSTIVATEGRHRPSIDAVGSTVFATYEDRANTDFRLAKSTDDGNTWATSSIHNAGTLIGIFSDIYAVDTDNLYVVYWDQANTRILFRSSSNGGTSWSSSEIVDTGLPAGDYFTIGVGSNKIHIGYKGVGVISVAERLISGGAWSTVDVEALPGIKFDPSMHVVDDDNIIVIYGIDDTTDTLTMSRKVGGSWQAPQTISSGIIGYDSSVVALDIDNIYVSYRNSSNGNLYFAKTTDGGATAWTITELDNGVAVSGRTGIGMTGTTLYISYCDSSGDKLKLATSSDSGDSWGISTLLTPVGIELADAPIVVLDIDNYHIAYDLTVAGTDKLNHYGSYIVISEDGRYKKIAITLDDGTTECYVEVPTNGWDPVNEVANIFFKAPALKSGRDTAFFLYYDSTHADNTTYVGDTGDTPAKSVWTDNYLIVQHNEHDPSGTPPQMLDSTTNSDHGTSFNMETGDLVDSQISKGLNFGGTNEYITIPDIGLNAQSAITLESIVNTSNVASQRLISLQDSTGDARVFIGINVLGYAIAFARGTAGEETEVVSTGISVADGVNHSIAGKFNEVAGDVTLFVDGVKIGTTSYGSTFTSSSLTDINIARFNDGGGGSQYLIGINDENRISNVARTDAWLAIAYYSNINNLLTVGGIMAVKYDRLLLAKTEATKGTDPVPVVGTDAVRCRSFEISVSPEVLDNVVVKQTMGMLPHLIGKETMQIEIEIALKGSGAAGTAPEIGPLLRACGLAETIVASTSVAYDPSSDVETHEGVTIYGYKDGLLWKFIGAVGNVTVGVEMNSIIPVTFTMQAPYTAPAAVADPAGAVYQSTQPLIGNSSNVVNDGAAIKVGSYTLDAGNDVQEHYVTSNHEFAVTDRNPVINFTKDSVSTAAEWTALSGSTTAALSGTFGSVAGNICAITAVDGRRESVAYGERAERDLLDVAYRLYESSGDDQFQIIFT